MSLLARLVYWLRTTDAPRFCPECGRQIEAKRADRFDPRTGDNVGQWYWRCPDPWLSISVHGEGWSVTRTGDTQHAWGMGIPRWLVGPPA